MLIKINKDIFNGGILVMLTLIIKLTVIIK